MKISGELLQTLWRFVRGDTDPREFEKWLYADQTLEAVLCDSLYLASIETDFGDRESVFQLKEQLRAFASTHDLSNCLRIRHPNITVIGMGYHEDFFASLETTHERGQPYWWLFATDCNSCGESWLVASEEQHNDVYILRRLELAEREAIRAENRWPSDFDRYETLLKIGKDAGYSVRFFDPFDSSQVDTARDLEKMWKDAGHSGRFFDPLNSFLVDTVRDLAKARPGIRISELASLLNVSNDLAVALAQKAAKRSQLEITIDVATPVKKSRRFWWKFW
jgi:hypothetical protein